MPPPIDSRRTTRQSALWGRGGKVRTVALVALAAALAAPTAGIAASRDSQALVPGALLAAAAADQDQVFHVIVQARRGYPSGVLGNDVGSAVRRTFSSIAGVSADLTGKELLKLARHPHVLAITPDLPTSGQDYHDGEMWRQSADVEPLWTGPGKSHAPLAPAIAVVDSGIDASKPDFAGRVVASVDLSTLAPGATGDQQGHGTMVAGIAAGSAAGHVGAAPNAPLVDVRTSDANGQSLTSDVIAACDWILAHRLEYGIRVVNISQAAESLTSFHYDPLDRAVERLWLNGLVVVTAAGNLGDPSGAPVDMSHAPGNDPFVITVGALDQNDNADPSDDTMPFWSAWGHTADGFAKPELSAPGRFLVMPVPAGSTIATAVADRIVAPGYMWMSGTSFSAPVVAGAAAQVLARNPLWTPDQVKGALMVSAAALPAAGSAAGVGEVDAAAAAAVALPPNPNAGLGRFVTVDPGTGAPVFDADAWAADASTNASWNEASWNEASWNEASWNEASWNEASWNEASWNEASWNEASWSEASWNESTLLP
jgi:serine protease AprX